MASALLCPSRRAAGGASGPGARPGRASQQPADLPPAQTVRQRQDYTEWGAKESELGFLSTCDDMVRSTMKRSHLLQPPYELSLKKHSAIPTGSKIPHNNGKLTTSINQDSK